MTDLNRCKVATIGVLLGLCTQAAQAQLDPAAIGRQNEVRERQQQELLRADQDRALRAAPVRPGADLKDLQPKVTVPDIGVKCRNINVVRIDNAAHLPDAVREQVEREFAGRCLGVAELESVLAQITKSYIERGFITTRAYLPAQDLRSGTLVVAVIEGTIEAFKVDGPRANAIWPRGVFPATPGDLLNLRDLEQGIEQANRLASNRAVLDIEPGTQPGQSVVTVRNPSATPINLFTSADNYGTEATGKRNASATVSLDSVLGLNELISVTRRESVPHDRDHNSVSNALQVSVPFGYSLLTLDASESRYANRVALPSGSSIMSNGKTNTRSATLDRVIYRGQATRLSLTGRLTTQDTESFLGGQPLGVASRKLAFADIGVSGFFSAVGGTGNARLAFVKGLSGFGALRDDADLPDDAPHAQFRKVTLDAGFSRAFEVATRPVILSTQISSQYSYDTLYGSQQFLVGGITSVRGSSLNTLSGDSGYLLRTELSLPWQIGTNGVGVGGRVYLGYDFGAVTNRAPGVPSGSMSGVALGTTVAWKGASLDVFVARARHLPSFMTRESNQFGLRLSYSL
ncbi:MAG: ShlB/FhaC/HecB family hemolysin secretion/activation protein [Comamonadaceae bacterium]|nr:MAG: ShlB/FhaC/HecB family hemolysin secretion/activation protein [Comamonadaceae bacterium]